MIPGPTMKRIIPSGVVCGLLLLLTAAGLLAQEKAEDKRAKAERYAKEWKKYIDEQNGNIYVSGEVVCSTGERLDGVKVNIDQCIAAGWENKHVKTTETVNKAFKFEFKGVQVVYLRFVRDGYHAEELELLFGEGAKPDRIEGKNFYYDNVHVVLEKIGELALLDLYEMRLTFAPDGKASVWDIARVVKKSGKPVAGSVRPVLKDVVWENIPPPGTVYTCLVPSATDVPPAVYKGTIVSPPKRTTIRVGVNDGAGGGLIRVQPEGRTYSRVLRDMKEAPEEGWQPFIELSNEDLVGFRSHSAMVCFYVKLNGMYGKGRISRAAYGRSPYGEEEILEANVEIRLQPNGTRNVETTEWR
jgi:hypothetical protein